MGLDTGATMGKVVVAESIDASATVEIPTAVEPADHTAALITSYTGPPEVRRATRRLREDTHMPILGVCP